MSKLVQIAHRLNRMNILFLTISASPDDVRELTADAT